MSNQSISVHGPMLFATSVRSILKRKLTEHARSIKRYLYVIATFHRSSARCMSAEMCICSPCVNKHLLNHLTGLRYMIRYIAIVSTTGHQHFGHRRGVYLIFLSHDHQCYRSRRTGWQSRYSPWPPIVSSDKLSISATRRRVECIQKFRRSSSGTFSVPPHHI
jgi:hypothetical protein